MYVSAAEEHRIPETELRLQHRGQLRLPQQLSYDRNKSVVGLVSTFKKKPKPLSLEIRRGEVTSEKCSAAHLGLIQGEKHLTYLATHVLINIQISTIPLCHVYRGSLNSWP